MDRFIDTMETLWSIEQMIDNKFHRAVIVNERLKKTKSILADFENESARERDRERSFAATHVEKTLVKEEVESTEKESDESFGIISASKLDLILSKARKTRAKSSNVTPPSKPPTPYDAKRSIVAQKKQQLEKRRSSSTGDSSKKATCDSMNRNEEKLLSAGSTYENDNIGFNFRHDVISQALFLGKFRILPRIYNFVEGASELYQAQAEALQKLAKRPQFPPSTIYSVITKTMRAEPTFCQYFNRKKQEVSEMTTQTIAVESSSNVCDCSMCRFKDKLTKSFQTLITQFQKHIKPNLQQTSSKGTTDKKRTIDDRAPVLLALWYRGRKLIELYEHLSLREDEQQQQHQKRLNQKTQELTPTNPPAEEHVHSGTASALPAAVREVKKLLLAMPAFTPINLPPTPNSQGIGSDNKIGSSSPASGSFDGSPPLSGKERRLQQVKSSAYSTVPLPRQQSHPFLRQKAQQAIATRGKTSPANTGFTAQSIPKRKPKWKNDNEGLVEEGKDEEEHNLGIASISSSSSSGNDSSSDNSSSSSGSSSSSSSSGSSSSSNSSSSNRGNQAIQWQKESRARIDLFHETLGNRVKIIAEQAIGRNQLKLVVGELKKCCAEEVRIRKRDTQVDVDNTGGGGICRNGRIARIVDAGVDGSEIDAVVATAGSTSSDATGRTPRTSESETAPNVCDEQWREALRPTRLLYSMLVEETQYGPGSCSFVPVRK